ncbi:MAG: hypothetical protein M1336_07365 [Deltaproteobacteria bacterium]|nr:hypothetical protein [Deltaproteobacteria bacterium]
MTWDDCNDLAEMTPDQIAEAQKCGFTANQWRWESRYGTTYVPADALTIELR